MSYNYFDITFPEIFIDFRILMLLGQCGTNHKTVTLFVLIFANVFRI